MEYRSPIPVSVDQAEEAFSRGKVGEICATLISVALNIHDREWVESRIVAYLRHEDAILRRCAAVSLGHSARVHGAVGPEVLATIQSLMTDPAMVGSAEDAMSDIEMFARRK